MKLDLHRLRHVLAVAETRSFSRAAEALAITQPALSRSIATLEEDLGLKIFDRGRAGVFITGAGAELIEQAQLLLGQAQGMEQKLLRLRDGESGTVKFGMAPMVASIYLPALLTRLSRAQPSLLLRPLVRKAEPLLAALASGEIEACFVYGPHLPVLDHICAEKLGTLSIGLFARAGHPLTQKPGLELDDLRAYPFAASVAEFAGQTGGPPLVTSILCDNYHLMKELILTSDTVCLMSPLMLREELRTGRVVPVPLEVTHHNDFDLCAMRMEGRTVSPGLALLLEQFAKIVQA